MRARSYEAEAKGNAEKEPEGKDLLSILNFSGLQGNKVNLRLVILVIAFGLSTFELLDYEARSCGSMISATMCQPSSSFKCSNSPSTFCGGLAICQLRHDSGVNIM